MKSYYIVSFGADVIISALYLSLPIESLYIQPLNMYDFSLYYK
jgi:hypothetical protein